MKQGWQIIKTANGIELIEVVAKAGEVASYEFCKRNAIQNLQEQIDRIESDEFLRTRSRPAFRAWIWEEKQIMLFAETKERAMAISGQTRKAFNTIWRECVGTWWYLLAKEEGFKSNVSSRELLE